MAYYVVGEGKRYVRGKPYEERLQEAIDTSPSSCASCPLMFIVWGFQEHLQDERKEYWCALDEKSVEVIPDCRPVCPPELFIKRLLEVL